MSTSRLVKLIKFEYIVRLEGYFLSTKGLIIEYKNWTYRGFIGGACTWNVTVFCWQEIAFTNEGSAEQNIYWANQPTSTF